MATSISFDAVARTALSTDSDKNGTASTSTHIVTNKPDAHRRELFLNHLWESLNSGAKILFFAVVTPVMLSRWGSAQFGLFAVANSCVALMAFLDLGLRTLTRVGLTNPQLSQNVKVRLHALNVAALSIAAGVGVGIVALLAFTGCWHRWLNLAPGGDAVITVTAALTAASMWLQLVVERIAAAGHLSRVKAALFAGNALAFMIVLALLKQGATAATVTSAYFAALGLPLLVLLPFANLRPRLFIRALTDLCASEILSALKSGGWINLITASWIFQSYGLVLLISWVLGPAAAGLFFLYLKLSELLSVLGASSSEPTIAAIASASNPQDRHRRFAAAYKSAIALCLAGAVGYTFFSADLFRIWLHRPLDHAYTGFLIGAFGVAGGFSRMITAGSLGLARPRPVALGLFAGAIVIALSVILLPSVIEPEWLLAVGCGSTFFLIPSAAIISRDMRSNFISTWLKPLARFVPGLTVIIIVSWAAARSGHAVAIVAAAILSSLICLQYFFQSPEAQSARVKNSLLGYDTRSWRSALVMRAVDLINPFRKVEEFRWRGPCVVSSTAGLGDLFIHLPLITGICNEAQRNGLETAVALRPVHAMIGSLCGWNVLPFDPALEDFFKNPCAIDGRKLLRQLRDARRTRWNLWIDLTGSAVSALSIKCTGARRLAARITRGGRSLVNYPLPHALHENEYSNIQRVAELLGCKPDYGIFNRLRGEPLPHLENAVVLCLTTVCRWRNWPLENFLAVVDCFPDVRFVVTGLHHEVPTEEQSVFAEILGRPNVISRMDELSIPELIRLIAHCRAVITNDTSTAHIANAFHKPGAVLFGPASPDKLAAPYGLKSFVDRTCPLHPCVQWTCQNRENWCMRKIGVESVARHLASIVKQQPLMLPQVEALVGENRSARPVRSALAVLS